MATVWLPSDAGPRDKPLAGKLKLNLLSRAREFIAYVKATFPEKKVLAVGHGIMNKAIQAVYYGKKMNEVQRMTNAEVRILEL